MDIKVTVTFSSTYSTWLYTRTSVYTRLHTQAHAYIYIYIMIILIINLIHRNFTWCSVFILGLCFISRVFKKRIRQIQNYFYLQTIPLGCVFWIRNSWDLKSVLKYGEQDTYAPLHIEKLLIQYVFYNSRCVFAHHHGSRSGWLILMVYQPTKGYFMPIG